MNKDNSQLPESKLRYWAVIPAAGVGQRMGTEQPKQYLEIDGQPILERSIRVMLADDRIEHLVVCVSPEDTHWPSLAVDDDRISSTLGGDSRAQSVNNGLRALAAYAHEDDWVLVHDAARPCLSTALLSSMIDELQHHDVGGILAIPAKDTLKLSSGDQDQISSTLDRTHVWQAQTPQMFRFGLLRDALADALIKSKPITDEASALEFQGLHPKLVIGDSRNIKVTTVDDIELAKFLLTKSN
jgi:2-C-methyl-D-erythritol 4-phosphate cytidylyltransferase